MSDLLEEADKKRLRVTDVGAHQQQGEDVVQVCVCKIRLQGRLGEAEVFQRRASVMKSVRSS